MMERIERESFGLFCPDLADVFVRREAFEGLETLGEVVGADEVGQMGTKLCTLMTVAQQSNRNRLSHGSHWAWDCPRDSGLIMRRSRRGGCRPRGSSSKDCRRRR